jgi:coproporphyrinogen III oxidase-like Fe-S oxidoreductase
VLDVARICGIDDLKHLSLFRLERDTLFKKEKKEKENKESQDNTNKLKELYFGNWLYHASFSPVWFDRIRKYRGYVDYTCQKVLFVDEDLMQLFYLKYGYEPDEQSQNTTDKCLKLNDGINWQSFHDKFKANSLFIVDEELIEELNNDKIQYPFYF